MVPRAGLEPAQRERRGILNPLCLPIPPPGHAILYCDAPNRKVRTPSNTELFFFENSILQILERHTRLELVTSTLARLRSTS